MGGFWRKRPGLRQRNIFVGNVNTRVTWNRILGRVRKFVEKFEENSRRNIEAKLRRRDRSLTAEIIDGNSSNVLRRWSCKFWNCSISWKIRFGTHVLLPDANKKHSNCTLISSHFVKLGSTDVQLTNSMIDKHSVSSIIYSTCAM